MPTSADVSVLLQHLKLALLREAYHRGLLTEAQLDTLLQGK